MLDEAWLTNCYVRSGPIAQKGDFETSLLLEVTLSKVLFEQGVCPLSRHIELSERGADIASVKDDITKGLFVFYRRFGVIRIRLTVHRELQL